MKLKKFAALALAGVMAVSMLAGCASKPATSEPTTEEPATTSLSASVIAALSADTTKKVTFTTDAALESAIKTAVTEKGTYNYDDVNITAVQKYYSKLPDQGAMSATKIEATDLDTAAKVKAALEASAGSDMVAVANSKGASADYVIKALAEEIDEALESYETQSEAFNYVDNNNDKIDARINYTYTGTVALVPVTDGVNGVVDYIAIYTLSRTGSVAKI